jgi:tetraacyldisaccharide 4'-kinase
MPPRFWQSKTSFIAQLLRPLSWLYGVLWHLRSWTYRVGIFKTTQLPIPVIIIGNVVAGGVGKTPILIELVKHYQKLGLNLGVISRGYGKKSSGCVEVTDASTADEVGDEPLLIFKSCKVPVYAASSRVLAAKALLQRHPTCQVIFSDDGLQHLAIGRDIEVVVFDERKTGNGYLQPAGSLREPWPRQHACDLHLVLNHVPRALADYAINGSGEQIPLAHLQSARLHALAGIAKPESFFDMLKAKGLVLTSCKAMPDHADLSKVVPPSGQDVHLICTEKDAVKLWPKYPEVLAVPLQLNLDSSFLAAIDVSIATLTYHYGSKTT